MKMVAGDYKDAIGQSLAAWYMEKSGIQFYTVYTATGFLDSNGNIKAVAIFTDFTKANIELHGVGPGAFTRSNIKSVLDYVFNQLGCVRLTTKLVRSNKKIAKVLSKLGFEYECTLKSYYGLHPSQDALVFRMFRQQAEKWIA